MEEPRLEKGENCSIIARQPPSTWFRGDRRVTRWLLRNIKWPIPAQNTRPGYTGEGRDVQQKSATRAPLMMPMGKSARKIDLYPIMRDCQRKREREPAGWLEQPTAYLPLDFPLQRCVPEYTHRWKNLFSHLLLISKRGLMRPGWSK